jgi:hypothetical protein
MSKNGQVRLSALELCLLASLLFYLPFQVSAQSTPQATDAPTISLAGMHALTAGSALVWAESVHSFQMWQVDVGGAGANAQLVGPAGPSLPN